jgi:hypothetical protein
MYSKKITITVALSMGLAIAIPASAALSMRFSAPGVRAPVQAPVQVETPAPPATPQKYTVNLLKQPTFTVPAGATGQKLTFNIKSLTGSTGYFFYRDGVFIDNGGGSGSTFGTYYATYKLIAGHTYFFELKSGELTQLQLEYTL